MKRFMMSMFLVGGLLMGALFVWGMSLPVQTSYAAQATTPTPSPDLWPTLEAQREQLEDLGLGLRSARVDVREEMVTWLGAAIVLGAIGGFIAGTFFTNQWLKKWFEEQIANTIYQVDPHHLIIHIPNNKDFTGKDYINEERLLRQIGFKNLRYYDYPNLGDQLLKGCLIYPAKNDADLEPLLEFLREKRPDPDECAVLAYGTGARYSDDMLENFIQLVRFATPNMITTLPSHIYGIARAMKINKAP
jgi:hypothetical protein